MLGRLAHAKINLSLHVGAPREDGLHPLASLVVFADIGDVLSVVQADDLKLVIVGSFAAGLSAGADNLVMRAADALKRDSGYAGGAHMLLEKNLPVASGIGGGSSDAAAALHLLNALWKLGYSLEKLMKIGARLGSDIPACLSGRAAHMLSTGTQLVPVQLPPLHAVLVNPRVPTPTGVVYQAFDRRGNFVPPLPVDVRGLTRAHDVIERLVKARNDLERAAADVVPEVADVLAILRAVPGVRLVRLSGSGATCFALFDDAPQAAMAAHLLHHQHPKMWIVSTVLNDLRLQAARTRLG
jgi:4-diphosphocytidyl-2-C-methyl-D-erythritol kinase